MGDVAGGFRKVEDVPSEPRITATARVVQATVSVWRGRSPNAATTNAVRVSTAGACTSAAFTGVVIWLLSLHAPGNNPSTWPPTNDLLLLIDSRRGVGAGAARRLHSSYGAPLSIDYFDSL